MGNLNFWLGIGAAQKANSLPAANRRHQIASVIAGILFAVLLAVGLLLVFVLNSQ
jgi:hypothetical protein